MKKEKEDSRVDRLPGVGHGDLDGVLTTPAPNDMSGYDEALVCNGQCGGYLDTPSKFRLFCGLRRGHAGAHVHESPGAKVSWDAKPEIIVSDELREKLLAAMAESDRLGPPIIAPDAAWTYHAVKGQAAVACRTHDQHNRRITDFISLETSPGRNAVADAVLIAKLLNEDERLRADALAVDDLSGAPRSAIWRRSQSTKTPSREAAPLSTPRRRGKTAKSVTGDK